MFGPPPSATRTYTSFPSTTLFRAPVVPRRLVSGQDCSERACRAGELVAEAGALGGHHLLRTGRALLDDPASQQFSLHLGHRRFSPCKFSDLDSRRWRDWRSEEHTSELQSLMRISYAVFCLKK